MKYLIFITLKILEISAVVFIPWGIGNLCTVDAPVLVCWLMGALFVIGVSGIGMGLFYTIPAWWKWNLKLVKKIMGRLDK